MDSACTQVNPFDRYSVAVLKNGEVAGHVRRELSRICFHFLQRQHSSISCRITGHRKLSEIRGKGLVVPCVYIFTGKQRHVPKLITLFTQLLVYEYCTTPHATVHNLILLYNYLLHTCNFKTAIAYELHAYAALTHVHRAGAGGACKCDKKPCAVISPENREGA